MDDNTPITEELLLSLGFSREDDVENDCTWWILGNIELHQERWGDFVGDDFSYCIRKKGERFKSGAVISTYGQLKNIPGSFGVGSSTELIQIPEKIQTNFEKLLASAMEFINKKES